MRFLSRRLAAAVALLCALAGPALAQSTGLTVTHAFGSYVVGQQITNPTTIATILAGPNASSVVPTGAASSGSSSGSPAPLIGSGTDFSANAPYVPTVGETPISAGLYAGYVRAQTIPATSVRLNVEVNDTSGNQIVLVFDDGTAGIGSAPVNATLLLLAPGAGIGAQGGGYNSRTFKGRISIYTKLGFAFVSAKQD